MNVLLITLTLFIGLFSNLLASDEKIVSEKMTDEKNKTACVKGLSANIRSEANLKASIVTNLEKYTPLKVISENENWTLVKSKNFQGWIFNELIIKDIKCVMVIQPGEAFETAKTQRTHQREKVNLNEAFKIIETQIGVTQVQDKYGNSFWIENQNLWPKTNLENLSLSL